MEEFIEEFPLIAFVEDVGAEDEIETFGEAIDLPIEPACAGAAAEGEAVEAGKENGRGFEIGQKNICAQRGGGCAAEAHAATEIEGADGGVPIQSGEGSGEAAGTVPEFGPIGKMLGILEADARESFAAIFLSDDVVENAVGISSARERNGEIADADVFGDGLEFAVNTMEQSLALAAITAERLWRCERQELVGVGHHGRGI